jgi:hypothetical protein
LVQKTHVIKGYEARYCHGGIIIDADLESGRSQRHSRIRSVQYSTQKKKEKEKEKTKKDMNAVEVRCVDSALLLPESLFFPLLCPPFPTPMIQSFPRLVSYTHSHSYAHSHSYIIPILTPTSFPFSLLHHSHSHSYTYSRAIDQYILYSHSPYPRSPSLRLYVWVI